MIIFPEWLMANNASMAVNNEVIVLDGGGGVGADPITTSTTDRGAGGQLTKWSIGTYISTYFYKHF